MLIKIDTSIIDYIKNNKEKLSYYDDVILNINSIVRSYKEGKHLIIAELEDLEFLSECSLLERVTQRIITGILHTYYTVGSYEDLYVEKIIAHMKSDEFFRRENEYWVPVNRLKNIDKTVLISENLTDCNFYIDLCKSLIRQVDKFKNQHVNFEERMCGGSLAYETAENDLKGEKFILLIMDSDKNFEDDTTGDSFNSAKRIYKENKDKHIIDLYQLNIREKENLVPPSILLLMDNQPNKEVLKFLTKYEFGEKSKVLRFCNIKDGLKAKKTRNQNEKFMEFYKEFIEDLGKAGLLSCNIEEIDCKKDEYKLLNGIGDKAIDKFRFDFLTENLSEKILEKEGLIKNGFEIPDKALSDLKYKQKKSETIYNLLPEYIKEDWYKLCFKLINWGCCASETEISLNP